MKCPYCGGKGIIIHCTATHEGSVIITNSHNNYKYSMQCSKCSHRGAIKNTKKAAAKSFRKTK